MNANQHYRRALDLFEIIGEPEDGMHWPDGRWVRARWHLAVGQALEGAERTEAPEGDER
jgi:hypothetical protein